MSTSRALSRRALQAATVGVIGLLSLALNLPTASAESLFSTAPPSASVATNDRSSVELGTRFSPTVNGTATGLRFYKNAENTGTHVGNLWSANGSRLATVTFTAESASGWQSARFSQPVSLTAGQQYVVSYLAPNGRYAYSRTAPTGSAVLASPKGVFKYGRSSQFPTSSWSAAHYWVDVNFTPGSPAAAPAPTPTTPSTTTPTTTPTQTPTTTPSTSTGGAGVFTTAYSAGVPTGWAPTQSVTGNYVVSTAGATISNLQVTNGSIIINAPNVTLNRVKITGGGITNLSGNSCMNGLVIQDTTIERGSKATTSSDEPAIQSGGYTARRVKIDGVSEGFRVGGKSYGCGAVTIEDSNVKIVAPDVCNDWHGDGIQGYSGPAVTVRNTIIDFRERSGCSGTAAFFYPHSQGNTSATVDGLLVSGGGYAFRLTTAGSVKNLNVIDKSWGYGPVEVTCSALSSFDARTVTVNGDKSLTTVRTLSC